MLPYLCAHKVPHLPPLQVYFSVLHNVLIYVHHSLNWEMNWNDFLLIVVPGSALYSHLKQLHLSFHTVQRRMLWDVLRRWDRGSPMINDERAREGIGAPPPQPGSNGPWHKGSVCHLGAPLGASPIRAGGSLLQRPFSFPSAWPSARHSRGHLDRPSFCSPSRLASVCQEASMHLPTPGEKRVGIFMVLVWLILRGH